MTDEALDGRQVHELTTAPRVRRDMERADDALHELAMTVDVARGADGALLAAARGPRRTRGRGTG